MLALILHGCSFGHDTPPLSVAGPFGVHVHDGPARGQRCAAYSSSKILVNCSPRLLIRSISARGIGLKSVG
jgi:hypothetical protein